MVKELSRVLKIIRLNHYETAGNMAEKIGMSKAYLYAIESGTREVPQDFYFKIINNYDLSHMEQTELHGAIVGSMSKVKFDMSEMSNERKDIMMRIASNDLDESLIKEMKILISNNLQDKN